jgi:hypothetical protein
MQLRRGTAIDLRDEDSLPTTVRHLNKGVKIHPSCRSIP